MKKILVVGVILLFLGVTVAPSINFHVVRASVENEFVEVTTEACGIKGYGSTTVKLTTQQYQNLEQYLVEFRARINQTMTSEEAIHLFNEAVVELNTYGLLPRGMTVAQGQRLVTSVYSRSSSRERNQRFSPVPDLDYHWNLCSLVAGRTNATRFYSAPLLSLVSLPGTLRALISKVLSSLSPDLGALFEKITWLPWVIYSILAEFLAVWILGPLCSLNPLSILNTGYIGVIKPSYGWVAAVGLVGRWVADGPFNGSSNGDPAIVGFTGFKIRLGGEPFYYIYDFFYLGSALKISIE